VQEFIILDDTASASGGYVLHDCKGLLGFLLCLNAVPESIVLAQPHGQTVTSHAGLLLIYDVTSS
jgi:hypothetical protein